MTILKSKIIKYFTIYVIIMTTLFNMIAFAAAALTSDAVAGPANQIASKTLVTNEAVDSILKDKPLLFSNIEYELSYKLDTNQILLADIINSINQLKVAMVSSEYTSEAYKDMQQEVYRLESIAEQVQSNISKISKWESEYYYAAKTWNFFIQQGYNEAVISGIIGNMMIETSGGSLALKPTVYDHTGDYYGLCQWSLYYRPEVSDMSFEDQLEYLASDMEKEFNTFGNCYAKGFRYEDFLTMDDPAEAAKAFAMVYERCGSAYYTIRMQAALEAFSYFNLK